MFDFGILGNNARNLHYIKKRNPRKGIRLADNKQKTKIFLSERGIPFAETYGIIKNRRELATFDFSSLPKKEFVVKPNHGSKGKGIYIVKYLGEEKGKEKPQEKKKNKILNSFLWGENEATKYQTFQIQGEEVSDTQMKRYFADILGGQHSLTMNDTILVEEKLTPGGGFSDFCKHGLADIRVIVFNLVPVASMIRIPTEKSGGKANINAGGIGCGIEVGTGKIYSTLHENKIYTSTFPKEISPYQRKAIPFWNDILFLSSKIQYFINLGYLALDRVITDDGPKLLEINARAGLEVQKIADIRLQNILDKVGDLKIQDPEKGVEICKTLFSKETQNLIKNSKILYLSQPAKLQLKGEEKSEFLEVTADLDLTKLHNYISSSTFQQAEKEGKKIWLDLYENDIFLRKIKFMHKEMDDDKIIIGKKTAENYLIKPIKKSSEKINIIHPKKIINMEKNELHILDSKIEKMSKRLNLTAKLRPTNYFNELDNFITRNGSYNPTFQYAFPPEERLTKREDDLKILKEQTTNGKLKSPMLQLFDEKIDELFDRLFLLRAYTHQHFENIEIGNKKLFGNFDEKLITLSKKKLFDTPHPNKELLGKELSFEEVRERIETYLTQKKIFGVDINIVAGNLARISLSMGKEIKLNLTKGISFREKDLEALLVHEIDTHLVRYINGVKSGWNIFKSGTAHYLKTEEGLAVRRARQVLPEEYENLGIYSKYYFVQKCHEHNFKELVQMNISLNQNRSKEGVFKTILRLKKGIKNTAKTGIGAYRGKDKIYLDGFKMLNNQINIDERINLGKIKFEDLEYLK